MDEVLAELLALDVKTTRSQRGALANPVGSGIWRARIVAECGGLENRYGA